MLIAVFLACSPSALAIQFGSCNPSWTPTFGPVGSVDDAVDALLVADAGTGPELFLGGNFRRSGPQVLHGVARWTGSGFAPLETFDDGSGPKLYAGG